MKYWSRYSGREIMNSCQNLKMNWAKLWRFKKRRSSWNYSMSHLIPKGEKKHFFKYLSKDFENLSTTAAD